MWQLSLVHLATEAKADIVFTSSFQSKLVLTWTEEIIVQSEPEKQDKNQISDKMLCNASDSELLF